MRLTALPVQQIGDDARELLQPMRRQRDLAIPNARGRDGGRTTIGPLDGQRQPLAHGTEHLNVAPRVRPDDPADEDELAPAERMNRQRDRHMFRRVRRAGGIQ